MIADILGDRMGCFLIQLPPSHHYTKAPLTAILSQLDPARRDVVGGTRQCTPRFVAPHNLLLLQRAWAPRRTCRVHAEQAVGTSDRADEG